MSRISRKLLSCILGVIACFALVFGVIAARPQTKTASADTPITFSAAHLGDASHDTYGTSIRFDTLGAPWDWTTKYYNWVSAEEFASIADYTTVNGRTVTEINNATTHTQKITLMMQPAGSFCFLRLYIPAEIMPLGDVKSMGILDGWSFKDSNHDNTVYTSSAVTFLRSGDAMIEESNYNALPKLTASNITISDAQLVNLTNAAWGADSYVVDINIGKRVIGEYDSMYAGTKYVRQAIYINGKSIEEWNTQKIAEDPRFKDPATYSRFPQNSTDPTHLDPFVKPVGLWGTSTGYRLTIFQELLADVSTVTVTVGEGATYSTEFMVAETVTKTVLTQNVVDVTKKLTFLDNSHNSPAEWGATKMYYINTNNEACWTKSPLGGCLNEYDPANSGGGQVQMKYIYFNGTSLYDINKSDNGSYGSTQDNIASGSIYAPILVTMSSELGSSLKLTVPTAFTNGKSGHEEIIVKEGFNVKEGNTSYYVSQDIVFTNTGNGWKTEVKANEIETEVTGIVTKANRTDGGTNENFVIFQLSNNDYTGLNTAAITDISSLYGYIDIGGTVIDSYNGEKFFNVWNIANSVAFRFADVATLQQVPYITIKAGAKFPAYATQNGGEETYYVTTEDVTFVHDIPNDTWTVGTYAKDTNTSVTGIRSVSTSKTIGLMLAGSDYGNVAKNIKTTYVTEAVNHISYTYTADGVVKTATLDGVTNGALYVNTNAWANYITFGIATTAGNVKSITITAGAKFPTYAYVSGGQETYFVTTEDITFYQIEESVWSLDRPLTETDVTSEVSFHHQGTSNGTELYMFKTQNVYWTKVPQGGCLNEYDPEGLGGGQVQMKSIYFNGTSLYDINKNDNGSYGSTQGNIASGGVYAPILVTMGVDNSVAVPYSFIQLQVPTAYTNEKAGHEEFEIKAGFSVTEGDNTYIITQNLKWINLNGSWVNANDTFDASDVSFENLRRGGAANELYMIDIVSNAWNITCNNYDFMYNNEDTYSKYRRLIYINGVSVYDINANTDDSEYVYSTGPSLNPGGELFAVPVVIETYTGNYDSDTPAQNAAPTNKITLWIHENYIKSLDGEITITLGAGFDAYTSGNALTSNVDYTITATVTIDGISQTVIKGETLREPDTDKPMTDTTIYTFLGWYYVGTDTKFDFATPITESIAIESRYSEEQVELIETQLISIMHQMKIDTDNWLRFELSVHDYSNAAENTSMNGYDELLRIGFLEKVILKGEINLNGNIVSQASLLDVYNTYGKLEGPYLNNDGSGRFAIRVPVGSGITAIVVEDGCCFPSYHNVSGGEVDTRYVVTRGGTYEYSEGTAYFIKEPEALFDIQMTEGASVRIKDIDEDFTGDASSNAAYETSGIRFETKISVADLDKLLSKLNSGEYQLVTFGTLIATTSDLMGGQFTHQWLTANNVQHADISCTAGFYKVGSEWTYAFPNGDTNYQSFYGSLVKLKEANYTRWFSGLGYLKIVDKNGDVTYYYATYNSVNSRSIAHVSQAAICDRVETETEVYKHKINDTSYSRYTFGVNNFLNVYVDAYMDTMTDSGLAATKLDELASPANSTLNPTAQKTLTINKKLTGAYVILHYSTNVNVRGVFHYQNTAGTIEASEDFYLQAGTTEHKQFLDIYRENGVGYGLEWNDLYMTSIDFSNVEFTAEVTGDVRIFGFYSVDKKIPVGAQEIYLTVEQNDGSSMTVGAHLGLGGGLTYLAKSGIYEGTTSSLSLFAKVAIKKGTTSGLNDYYGHATSSLPSDDAVNLINNYDAGRQIQQSWYAAVGDAASNATVNGYSRAFCKTESPEGKYWPYNPVQAGDVVSNPSQIIDYDVDEAKGYIYVKARAMDWAKGQKSSDKLDGTIVGGSTTKSYVENYYRLNADGTLYVNNAFVDWNGFTDMDSCNWASTELPAVYPVHTLNYYVSNLDGDGSWTDVLEYKSGLGSWTNEKLNCIQLMQPNAEYPYTMVEEWFAWANDSSGTFALGMYIPNVNRLTSGRSQTSTTQSTSGNNNSSSNILKSKGLMSNMQTIKKSYQSAYVGNTSYTAPGISFRMEAYKTIDYTYVIALNSVTNIRSTFKTIKDNGTVTNAGQEGRYEKVGLDAWARADKMWTW